MVDIIQKKKNAVMLADTRVSLVGTTLLQLNTTNPGLFDEAIIYYLQGISSTDQNLLNSIMPCRFIKYSPPLPKDLFSKPRFSLFSPLMFARYEMFSFLNEFETITWLDTDILIQKDLRGLIDSAKINGAALIREDPQNKTAKNTDRMKSCFVSNLPGQYRNDYLYCSGTIVLSDKLVDAKKCIEWCYSKTVEWADNLSLPDQGVINALIQEFNVNVSILPGKIYCCYPYLGRDCSDAAIIHSWGLNKFWNDWYLYQRYPQWSLYYSKWATMGGSVLDQEFKPKISVVIPVYKPDIGMFRQCLDSLMEQKRNVWERFSNFEVIIIAEPTEETDEIVRLVESYNDLRIRLEVNDNRLGIAASINKGIRLANANYIARIDDDDIASEYRLIKQSDFLDQHPDVTLCTTDFEYFGDMNEYRYSFDGEMAKAWSIFTCPFDHPTIMFRRDFFIDSELLYDEQRGYVEDWELWIRAFDAGMKVGCIHEGLLFHRWINNSSAGQTNKTIDMMRELVQKNFQKVGVEIPIEDLPLIGPWNGRLMNVGDISRVESYFSDALEKNLSKQLYDQNCLQEAFNLRIEEMRTGNLPGLIRKLDTGTKIDNTGKKISNKGIIKRILKKLFKPMYQPIRNRFEDRLINLQQSNWEMEGHIINLSSKIDETDARLNTIADKLNEILLESQYQKDIQATNLFLEKKILLIGTPEHSNIGDAAITIGEMEFIRQFFPNHRLVELSTYDFNDYYDQLSSIINCDDIIFLQGGGNMGNKYLSEENTRRRVISDFPDNKIVILPQTIHYDNCEEGLRELAITKKIVNKHRDLTIFTRGTRSLNFANEHFTKANCVNAIDMALMLSCDGDFHREGILLCIRDLTDESGFTRDQYSKVINLVRKIDADFLLTNNLNRGDTEANIYKDMRRSVISEEFKKFSERKVVVTDRLHGLIFAIITKTPCVVMSSYNRKIEDFCTFFADSNAVFFIDRNIERLEEAIQKASLVDAPEYPILKGQPFAEIFQRIGYDQIKIRPPFDR